MANNVRKHDPAAPSPRKWRATTGIHADDIRSCRETDLCEAEVLFQRTENLIEYRFPRAYARNASNQNRSISCAGLNRPVWRRPARRVIFAGFRMSEAK